MAFKMKQFSGFGNSPMKQDGKLSKKKKDLKTGEDVTSKSSTDPKPVEMPALSEIPSFLTGPGKKKKKTSTVPKPVEMPVPSFLTGPGKKKKKTSTDSAIEKYFKN